MQIGFIGYGTMAAALASRWVKHHEIVIGGRNEAKAKELAKKLGHETRWGNGGDAVRDADVVVLATHHGAVFEAMDAAGGPSVFAGKTLVDINNPVPGAFDGEFLNHSYDGLSLAEKIAAYAPEAHVVKAFNMCQASVWTMQPPIFDGRKLVVLYCGDDESAKARAITLIDLIGCDHVDIGELKYARLLEAAAAIVIKLLFSGRDTHTVLNLIQPESERPL
ncbi:MAG: NAD(P)-binding domain-containing protein [Desulfobacterales bacterium]